MHPHSAPKNKKAATTTTMQNGKDKLHKLRKKKKKAALIRKSSGVIVNGTQDSNVEKKNEVVPNGKKAETSTRIPIKCEEASGNWKSLMQELLQTKQDNEKRSEHAPKWDEKKQKLREKDRRRAKRKRLSAKLAEEKLAEEKPPTVKPDIWFDGVDEDLLDDVHTNNASVQVEGKKDDIFPTENVSDGLTKIIGLDCEMVGVSSSRESILARVSIVNQFGHCIYDKYVKPTEKVIDYRTPVSGIRPEHLKKGEPLEDVQKEVAEIMKGRILVGHALSHDLSALFMSHPKRRIRDTSLYKPFRKMFGGRTPSLKKLAAKLLSVTIQEGEHNSIQDAQAAVRIYTMYKQQWENDLKSKVLKQQKKKGASLK